MNESQHLSSQFDEDLGRLRTHVLQMGGMVETQISSAVDAYATGEIGSVKSIVDADHKVNELEKAIDDDCTHSRPKSRPRMRSPMRKRTSKVTMPQMASGKRAANSFTPKADMLTACIHMKSGGFS